MIDYFAHGEVTFIGGPMDLTKKVVNIRDCGPYLRFRKAKGYDFPQAPQSEPSVANVGLMFEDYDYRLMKLGINPTTQRPIYVAVLKEYI